MYVYIYIYINTVIHLTTGAIFVSLPAVPHGSPRGL